MSVDDAAGGKRAFVVLGTVLVAIVIGGLLVPVSASTAPPDSAAPGDSTALTGTTATSTQEHRGITNVNYTGSGIAARQNDTTYVWQDGNTSLVLTVLPFENVTTHQLCVNLTSAGGENASNTSSPVYQHGCKEVRPESSGTRVSFSFAGLPVNDTGPYHLVATLRGNGHVQNETVPIYVLERNGDLDGDNLRNEREVKLGTDLNGTDTDSDGLQDGAEVNNYGTDPTDPDTDGDGVRDAVEIQQGTDPTDPNDVERGTDPTEPGPTGTPTGETAEPVRDPGGLLFWLLIAAALVLSASIGVVAYSRFGGDGLGRAGGADDAGGAGGGDSTSMGAGQPPTEKQAGPPYVSSDEDPLSPEGRVHQLLRENDGRIKQSEVVERTDWSKAKVSRTLASMEDKGEISRTRIGRENVVTPPDEEPET